MRLRNIPVLAELAGEITAGGAKRKNRRTGVEVIQRLFFNRIDAKTRGPAVGGQHHLIVNVLTYEACAALAFMQRAVTWAEVALNTRCLTVGSW